MSLDNYLKKLDSKNNAIAKKTDLPKSNPEYNLEKCLNSIKSKRDDGFEKSAIESILRNAQNPELYAEGKISFEYNNKSYFIEQGTKQGSGNEIDILVNSKNNDYSLSIECKDHKKDIGRSLAYDSFARDDDLNVDFSIALKKDNGNEFNWKNTYEACGIVPMEYSKDIGKEILKLLDLRRKDSKEMRQNSGLFKAYNFKLREEINKKYRNQLKYGINFNSKNLSTLNSLLSSLYPNAIKAINISDLILSPAKRNDFGPNDSVSISIPAAIINNNETILAYYTSTQISLKDARKIYANCKLTDSKGIYFYEKSKGISAPAKDFIKKFSETIKAIPLN